MTSTISRPPLSDLQKAEQTQEFVRRAEALVPLLREHAAESERNRYVSQEVIKAADQADLFRLMVPRVWGGHGLDLRALTHVARVLAQGDVSSSWAVCFLIEHNWMAARLPMEAQEEIFANGGIVLAAAPLQPGGTAVRVDGGWELSGTWRYASGMPNSTHAFVTAVHDDGETRTPWSFLIPATDVTVHDDWFMAGAAATGSCSLTGERVFVPEHRAIETARLNSVNQHPGAVHEDAIMRYPLLISLAVMMAGFAVGAAERGVELFTERLRSHAVYGVKRIDMVLARSRWLEAHQKTRTARLLLDSVLETTTRKGDAVEDWSDEEEGQFLADRLTIVHLAKDAVRLIADGAGSSAYQLDNPIQRYLRDVDVIANHIGHDWDSAAERAGRLLLGLGYNETDPFAKLPILRDPVTGEATRHGDRPAPGLR
jgi:3-hydroxy-9,10-secoandrosta-1,3,5(10)-triene-9,17-dione monooxygenase